MKPTTLLATFGLCLIVSADDPSTPQETEIESKEVVCEGIIVSFEDEGFQALTTDGYCEWSDLTWIRITSPERFRGVRYMYLSEGTDEESSLGKVGKIVKFTAYESTLESSKLIKKLQENPIEIDELIDDEDEQKTETSNK